MVAATIIGCGGGAKPAGVPDTVSTIVAKQHFTTKAELEELAAAPTPEVAAMHENVVVVDDWAFEGDAAGSDEEEVPPNQAVWRAAVIKAAGGDKKAAFDPALHCVAEQLGRFRLAHEGWPTRRWKRFVASRCGAAYDDVGVAAVSVSISPEAKDVEAFAAMDDLMRDKLETVLAREDDRLPTRHGVWFHREGEQAVFSVVNATERMRVEVDQEGRNIHLRGRARDEAQEVSGWINRGDDDVAPCQVSGNLPELDVQCQLGPDDEQARLDLRVRDEGELVWRRVASLVVHAEGRQALKLVARPRVEGEGSPSARLIAEANRLRAKKNAPPLVEAKAQSAHQTQLTPKLTAAYLNDDTKLAQRIVLGGLAGWHVSGPLSDAHALVGQGLNRDDPATWVAELLESPSGRVALLDPTMTQIAVGLTRDDPVPGLGGFITTYAPFTKRDPRPIADYAQKKLDQARAKRGLPATRRRPLQALAMALSRIEGGADPTEVFREAAESAQFEMKNPVTAGYQVVSHPSQIVFPETLVEQPTVAIDIRVVQHDFPETNWGTYIVFFFFADDPNAPRTATLPLTPRHL